jgi:hypothetical protein
LDNPISELPKFAAAFARTMAKLVFDNNQVLAVLGKEIIGKPYCFKGTYTAVTKVAA